MDAFADMVQRSLVELRKIGAFDETVMKDKSWTSIQFWKIVQVLSARDAILYDELLMDPLFKADPFPVQQMERAGLVTCVYQNGRPYLIKPGRPIFKVAFTEMVNDDRQRLFMEAVTCKQLAEDYTKKLRDFEAELELLNGIEYTSSAIWRTFFGDNIDSRKQWLVKMIARNASRAEEYTEKQIMCKSKLKLK